MLTRSRFSRFTAVEAQLATFNVSDYRRIQDQAIRPVLPEFAQRVSTHHAVDVGEIALRVGV